MSLTDIIVIGAGGHAHSVIDVIESGSRYKVRGLIDSNRQVGDDVFGYQVLAEQADLKALLRDSSCELVIAIGDNFYRHRLHQQINAQIPDAKFATLIHPRACVSRRSYIGTGSVVMAGAIVNAGCQIADGVIVNTAAVVDHDCIVGSFASVAPNVTMGGSVCIGARSSIGLGAKLVHRIKLGKDICVGAGSLVLKSIDTDCVVVYGAPSKIVRQRRADEAYL